MLCSVSRASKISCNLMLSAAALPMFLGTAAMAQTAADKATPQIETVTVTGTRVQRDGYQAPTPVSVVSADELAKSGTPNIADYVNTLPAVSGSATPITTATQVGAGRQGIDSINLHNIGDVSTLTLLDGRRIGGMINTGVVDAS